MAFIAKTFKWEASHQLPGHKGKCANLHGHSYRAEIYVEGPIKSVTDNVTDGGMVFDFSDLSGAMDEIVKSYLDHKHLNDSVAVPRTTAELIACWIYGSLRMRYKLANVREVIVWETATSRAGITYHDWFQSGCPGLRTTDEVESEVDPYGNRSTVRPSLVIVGSGVTAIEAGLEGV